MQVSFEEFEELTLHTAHIKFGKFWKEVKTNESASEIIILVLDLILDKIGIKNNIL